MKKILKAIGVGTWLLLALTACTPREQADLPEISSPAVGAQTIRVTDGTELPARHWLPDKEPTALVVAVHGFNDYSNAFETVGQYLRKERIAVFAYDQRGFGATKEKGIWGGENNLISDLRDVTAALKATYPDLPIYLLGESMGGAVIIASVDKPDFPDIDGIILSAPAVWGSETMNALYRSTLWLMAHTVPGTEVTGSGLNIIASDNLEMLRAMGRDPLVIKRTRVDAVYGIVELMDEAYERVPHITGIPILFLYGQRDQVIPPDPIQRTILRLQTSHRVAYYPTGYHMLLRDLKSEVVMNDMVHWLGDRESPLPSGFEKDWQTRMKDHVLTLPKKSPTSKSRWPSQKRR